MQETKYDVTKFVPLVNGGYANNLLMMLDQLNVFFCKLETDCSIVIYLENTDVAQALL